MKTFQIFSDLCVYVVMIFERGSLGRNHFKKSMVCFGNAAVSQWKKKKNQCVFYQYTWEPLLWVCFFPIYLIAFFSRLFSFCATEQLLEFMHQLPAFANMTMSVRRELCSVMVFEVVEQAGTVILHNKQEVWTHSYTC